MRKSVVVVTFAALLQACASLPGGPDQRPVTPIAATPSAIPTEKLVGRWGVASYREEKDRRRVETIARSQCKQPYVIAKGPSDGVMMHAADDPNLYELKLKGGPGGKTYLGFEAPPGDPQDREILSFTDKMFVARFVDPDIDTRYGTYIYVRCT